MKWTAALGLACLAAPVVSFNVSRLSVHYIQEEQYVLDTLAQATAASRQQARAKVPGSSPFYHCDSASSSPTPLLDIHDLFFELRPSDPVHYRRGYYEARAGEHQQFTSELQIRGRLTRDLMGEEVTTTLNVRRVGGGENETVWSSTLRPLCNVHTKVQDQRAMCPPRRSGRVEMERLDKWSSSVFGEPGDFEFTVNATTSQGQSLMCFRGSVAVQWAVPAPQVSLLQTGLAQAHRLAGMLLGLDSAAWYGL